MMNQSPFAQHFSAEILGIPSHYLRWGDPKAPQKLVLLHGWGGSWQSFVALCQVLEADPSFVARYELVLLDFPGFGWSAAPEKGWSTIDYAIWTQKLLSNIFSAEKKVSLSFYVHSFGGRVLTRLLTEKKAQLPPKFSAENLIWTGAAGIKFPLSVRQKAGVFLSKNFTQYKKHLPLRAQKLFLNRVLGARDWGSVSLPLKPTLRKVLAEPDLRTELQKIPQRSLLIWGEKDSVTPLEAGEIYAENLPQAQLKTIPAGKHGIHHTHPQLLAQWVSQFLGKK